jgi:hypothetical protein
MLRLLIEDVTLIRSREVTIRVRFKGGATNSLTVSAPLSYSQMRKTSPEVLREVASLLNGHTYEEIAKILNDRGWQTCVGNAYKPVRIMRIQERYGLRSRYDRRREAGYLTVEEMAPALGIAAETVQERRKRGLLKSVRLNDRPEYLYEFPTAGVGARSVTATPAR